MSQDEGHEAITRAAWVGLPITERQQRALIDGVRAPDTSLVGLLIFALPFAQPRHALRAWRRTTTRNAVVAFRRFVATRHLRALADATERGRWQGFGEVLHAVQDAWSPAHADRDGARIIRMKHWGAFGGADEHGFPADSRDHAIADDALTDDARPAVDASRRYLELVARQLTVQAAPEARRAELITYLDAEVTGPEP